MKKSTSQNIKDNNIYNINEKDNVKSNVLYSIPCVKSCAHFWKGALTLTIVCNLAFYAHTANAITLVPQGVLSDSTTISAITGTGSIIPPTASLSLSNPNMTSSASAPGSTVTVDTDVTVNVTHTDSYSLILKFGNVNMANGNTTITAGSVIDDNTWGYKWDGASTYTTPSATGASLAVPTLDRNKASFTKNLTFGAKFADNADAGTYHASGVLSLIVSPETTVSYTLADLTQLQQLTLAPDACTNTPYLSGQNYSAEYTLTDVRDNNTYTVRRLGDGKCWMTQNLRLSTQNGQYLYGRRWLIPDTTDVSSSWYLPEKSSSGFNNNTTSNAYVSNDIGYYSWCAATAGTAGGCINPYDNSADSPTNPITSGNASSSICPKGWKLPTGGPSGNTDFYNLFNNLGLKYADGKGTLATSGNTNWGTGDLAKVQGSPYNLVYTGYMYNGSLNNATSNGYWWSRTAFNSTSAYHLYINGSIVYPGTLNYSLFSGFAVRCVAE